MATAPTNPSNAAPTVEELALQKQFTEFFANFNSALFTTALAIPQMTEQQINPVNDENDIKLVGAQHMLNAHLYHVNDAIADNNDFYKRINQTLFDDNTPPPGGFEKFRVRGAEVDTLVGGKGKMDTGFNRQVSQSQPQYPVLNYTTADGNNNVKLNLATNADGGMNSYVIAYIDQLNENKEITNSYSTHFNEDYVKCISREKDIQIYAKDLLDSQKMRKDSNLPTDGILRNLGNSDDPKGLPHITQTLDNFYKNLPELHPHRGIKPYEEQENKFFRELHADMFEKKVRYDYAIAVEKSPANQRDSVTINPGATARSVNDTIGIMFSAQNDKNLTGLSAEEIALNLNRTTHRSSSVIAAFLATDPEIKATNKFLHETVMANGPDAALRQLASSDYSPNNVNFSNIAMDVRAVTPNTEQYKVGLTSTEAGLKQVSKASFGIDTSQNYSSVIIAEGHDNMEVMEDMLSSDQKSLGDSSILNKVTEQLSALDKDTIVPKLRGLYTQAIKGRNVPGGSLDLATIQQTIVLTNPSTDNTINSGALKITRNELAKANVMFIPPPDKHTSWSSYVSAYAESDYKEPINYFSQQVDSFNEYRKGLLDKANIANNSPPPAFNTMLKALVADSVLNEEAVVERKQVRNNDLESLTKQVDEFEAHFSKNINTLSNVVIKDSLASMTSFFREDLARDTSIGKDFGIMAEMLKSDLHEHVGTNDDMNRLGIGLIGKIMIDSHLKLHNKGYERNPDAFKYQQEKVDLARKLGESVSTDPNFDFVKKQQVGEKVGVIVSNFIAAFPSVNTEQNNRVINSIKNATAKFMVNNNEADLIARGLKPAVEVSKPIVSPSIKPMNDKTMYMSVDEILNYGSLESKGGGGLFDRNADVAARFAAAPPAIAPAEAIKAIGPTPVEEAVGKLLANPAFHELKDSILKTFNPYEGLDAGKKAPKSQAWNIGEANSLLDRIPELNAFVPSTEQAEQLAQLRAEKKTIPREMLNHFDSQDIKSIGSAQPDSAATTLGLSYLVAPASTNYAFDKTGGEKPGEHMAKTGTMQFKPKDYASADLMIIDMLSSNIDKVNEVMAVSLDLKSALTVGIGPNLSKVYSKDLKSHFSDLSAPIFEHDLSGALLTMNVDKAIIDKVEVAVQKDYVAGINKEVEKNLESGNTAFVADSVKSNPEFRKFMDGMQTDNIANPTDKSTVASVLDIHDSLTTVFPQISKLDIDSLEKAPENSAVAQLELTGNIRRHHGGAIPKNFPVELAQHSSFDDTVLAFMSTNAEHLDTLAQVAVSPGTFSTKSTNEDVLLAVKTLVDRGVNIIHPDMYTKGAAELADALFPNEVNNEFNALRDVERKTVASSINLELHVSDNNGFVNSYKLNDYATPEDLHAQQKSDFRGDENLKVSGIRCHTYGEDVARAIVYTAKEPLAAFPDMLPKQMWTQSVDKYLSNDDVVNREKLTPTVVQSLNEKADASFKDIQAMKADDLTATPTAAENISAKTGVEPTAPKQEEVQPVAEKEKLSSVDMDMSM